MRFVVIKALNFVNRDDQNPSENIWDEFVKMSKFGISMESLNADFFQFSGEVGIDGSVKFVCNHPYS